MKNKRFVQRILLTMALLMFCAVAAPASEKVYAVENNPTAEENTMDMTDVQKNGQQDTAGQPGTSDGEDSSQEPAQEPEQEPETGYYLDGNRLVDRATGKAFAGTGFVLADDEYYYVTRGVWNKNLQDVIKVANVAGSNGEWWYVKNGKADFNANTVAENSSGWWKITNGRADFGYTGIAQNSNGWWYCEDGKVNFRFSGFAENENGWWYVEDGRVKFDKSTVIKGRVDGKNGWWYVKRSQVMFTDTVAKNENGWWYIDNGRVNFSYDGFGRNSNGWWYCQDGKVSFRVNSVVKGTVDGQNGWWYVRGSKVSFTDTVAKNSRGWWCIENGKVDFGCNSVERNSNGWWKIRNGKVDFKYSGLAENENGCWLIRNGKVNFSAKDVVKGTVKGESGWWYVEGGKVTYKTTVAKNSRGWWCVEKGKVNFKCNSIDRNQNGWWKIRNGKVDFSFDGIAQNKNGWWYCKDGKVQFGTTTVAKGTVDGKTAWWYISKGKVNKNYNGLGTNSNGTWLIEDGKVNFSFNGSKTINGVKYTFVDGRCISNYRGWQRLSGKYYYFDRETGAPMRNCTVDGIRLKSDGSAVSSAYNNEKIRTMMKARSIMASVTNESDSKEVKLKKCFNWVMRHPYKRYRTLKVARQKAGWEMLFANDHFERGNGCCVSDACAFAFLAHECGYKTVYICDDTAHSWVEINGYVYDPLFAEAKNYNNNYKAPYSVYRLHPAYRTKI